MNSGPPPLPSRTFTRKLLLPGLAVVVLVGGALFRVYGMDTHHADRSSIWWSDSCRSRIPPAATDITLRRDLLDHHATYTITEADLHAFFAARFGEDGGARDASADRRAVAPERVGEKLGPFGWVVTEHTVSYTLWTPNGAVSHFYHDPTTGLTCQESAYW